MNSLESIDGDYVSRVWQKIQIVDTVAKMFSMACCNKYPCCVDYHYYICDNFVLLIEMNNNC